MTSTIEEFDDQIETILKKIDKHFNSFNQAADADRV